MKPSRDIQRLLDVMAALRTPISGCPWDLEQDFASIAPYTIEEAHEVAEAIARDDMDDLCDELGDLLLQVVFHARMAEEQRLFDFGAVVEAITSKMIRRHPHVFGIADAGDARAVKVQWEDIKAEERRLRAARRADKGLPAETGKGLLERVGRGLPPLARAVKLQDKAGTVGFDWKDPLAVLDKLREETEEIAHEIQTQAPKERLQDEIGDVLFVIANLARHLDIDPDAALRGTNEKFIRRFRHIEQTLDDQGMRLEDATLEAMERLWQDAKKV